MLSKVITNELVQILCRTIYNIMIHYRAQVPKLGHQGYQFNLHFS